MPRLPISSFLLSAVLILSSCGSRQTAATLNDVESYIQDRPDSALAVIRAIDTTTLTTRSLRAQYALLHAIALDKNWIDTTDINVVMPAVEYYDRHSSDLRRAKAWYYLGRIRQNAGNYPDASISFLKAERYAEPFDADAFKALICLAISTIYSQTHFHEESLKYAENAHSLFAEVGDTLNANAALYSIAQEYYDLKKYSEADSLYRLLIESNQVHANLQSFLLGDYALSCVYHAGDYARAVQLFDKAIAMKGTLKNWDYWGAYAYALLRTGNTSKAEKIFEQLALGKTTSQVYLYDVWKSLSEAYSKDYESAYQLLRAASDIQDENVKKAFRQSAIKAQKDFLEELSHETEKAAKKRRGIAWCSVAVLVACILALLFLIKRRKEKTAQEKEELLDAFKNLTMKHSVLFSRYSDLTEQIERTENEKASVRNQYIQLCQTHFGRIGRINEVLYYHSSSEKDKALYKELKKAIRSIGMDNNNQCEFELLLNEAFDNVMVHFREAFPNRKNRYYQLVGYLFAGFESSTICAIIPGFQKHNVHVERSRLKQRIQLSDSQYKDQFLQLL